MFPFFTNAALLAGLAGLSIPVLIHLLLRRKSQRLRFSTIQFFVKRDEQSSRKRKLRNLLLLALRLLVFALIVFAFARPYLRETGAAQGNRQRQQVLVLLDASASMQAAGSAGSQWNRAKELARGILTGLNADDRAALISCSTQTTNVSEFAPPQVVARRLADLQPTSGSGELASGLRQAAKLLATADPGAATALYVISDLQRSAAENLAGSPLPAELTVKVLDLGERFIPNVAVTELEVEPDAPAGPRAIVTSFSDEDQSGLQTVLKVDGKEIQSQSIVLPAGGSTNISLAIPRLSPGWHGIEFAVLAKDGLPADDNRYRAVFVADPLRAVLVESRKTPRAYQEETFFVATALDPSSATNGTSPSQFAVQKVSPEELAPTLQPKPGEPAVDLVVLPGLKQLPVGGVGALATFVQNGGGLLLFLGETVSPNRYNTELRELLPAQIGATESAPENDLGWRIGVYDKTSPLFKPFRQPNSGNLGIPEFRHRFTLTPVANSIVAAEFDDGTPFLVERKLGRGRIVLVNTSADTAWTDWAKHKTFVPWLHGAGHRVAARTEAENREPIPDFPSGGETEFELGAGRAGQSFRWQRLGGPETPLASDQAGRIRDVFFDRPGLYTLKDSAGRELRRVAANLPLPESELTGLAPADFQQQMVRTTERAESRGAGLFGSSGRGKEFWRVLLLSALILMLIEPVMANRTLA